MSDVDLLGMYSRAAQEAFRLEAQQRYAVPAEDAQFRAFTEGRPLPSDPRVNRSMQVIRSAVARGTRIRRVHVVDLPLTAYLRYEMAAYQENIDAGEEVSIAIRSWHPDLAELTEDFVLFDPGSEHQAMVWMRYDDQGQLTGRVYSDDPGELARAGHRREVALAHAVSLHEFVSLADTG
jgi:hypothetical protein